MFGTVKLYFVVKKSPIFLLASCCMYVVDIIPIFDIAPTKFELCTEFSNSWSVFVLVVAPSFIIISFIEADFLVANACFFLLLLGSCIQPDKTHDPDETRS